MIIWYLLYKTFYHIGEYEENLLTGHGLIGLIKARGCSLISMVVVVYLGAFIVTYGGVEILKRLSLPLDGDFQRWWLIPLLISLPILIPLATNFFNRSFNYSKTFADIMEILMYSSPQITSTRTLLEIMVGIAYVLGTSILSIYALTNFMTENTILSLFKNDFTNLFKVLVPFHSVIYLTMRALLLPEQTLNDRFIKCKSRFNLWTIATLVTSAYMTYKVLSSNVIIDYLYIGFAFLISIDRAVSSFKDLRKVIYEHSVSTTVSESQSHIA